MQDTLKATNRRGYSAFKAELENQLEEMRAIIARMDARQARMARLEEETRVLREETREILRSINCHV